MAKNTLQTFVSKSDYEHLAALRYALRVFLRFSEEAAKRAGLTAQQHQALLAIMGFPGRERVTIGELAERLQIRHHSAVGLVDRMVILGLVERELSTDDRRQVYVVLTKDGRTLLNQLVVAHLEELQRIKPYLSQLLQTFGSELT